MNKKYVAPYDVSVMLSEKAAAVTHRIQDILMESQEKTIQKVTSEANKLAYDLAERTGRSLWDICLTTIPDRSYDMEEIDGKMQMVVKVKIEPIEFDFTHSPDYWEKKYKELKRQLIELTFDKPEKDDEGTAIGDNH